MKPKYRGIQYRWTANLEYQSLGAVVLGEVLLNLTAKKNRPPIENDEIPPKNKKKKKKTPDMFKQSQNNVLSVIINKQQSAEPLNASLSF